MREMENPKAAGKPHADIGIIGGTGVYDMSLFRNPKEVKIGTPFGAPSDFITIGELGGKTVAFLPRHGKGHKIPPHNLPSRANIWAMKELGVTRILAPSAVGSLREEIGPGDIVLPDQFIDRTKSRPSTFYEGGQVCHISTADPFCNELRSILSSEALSLGLKLHPKGTYVCIEGPRFSTRAESNMFRQWGADIVGMTLFPEAVLAREAEICYATIAMSTDYDCWKAHSVSNKEVIETMKANVDKVRHLLQKVIPKIPEKRASCRCGSALEGAMM